ncbi:citrate lyase subunit beta-like protein, mitochondrial [Mizuhopecten yessoensis]|uniref:citrate lyase subunit beta-like protein, mitochondrial n=1 Tax=Mizuhopecten yessoensis TaxID=6573 RepID=UPI000B45F790|nr:citrate lyase subunit beta-like protein, mitochondrial [Mizuhopecten yessoensis]XP_021357716.1 citrate lyase subunit beta-like protein, mitochondrial [Mizuhopecten yessoensis]XP_021357722.1 citrate lyase subunit beta-like protein, mitochondrial [Mizuhopecten yessoensis]XP_021357729.1 citrate lyase subunit beta-like protein, mitochondrial [Mizuhopecten yessoensis]XP_021357735.1 citrate lyase subunit beta-like protein, mitochondrial [Mizuhopecten yessoensis]
MKGTLNFKRMLTLTRRLQKCYTRCMSCGQIKTLGWRQHEHPIGQGRQLSSCTDTLPTDKYTPRRAVLYVPGNDERKLQKIAGLNVDCAVMDCEDGVAINRKEEARNTIKKMLDKLDFGRTECVVRVNSVDSGLIEDDLKVIFRADRMPQTIMLPKVNRPEEMYQFTDNLKESLKGRTQEQKLQLITFVESAIGLINLTEILRKTIELTNSEGLFNLAGVVFGSDDFCADIGATRTPDAAELMYARQKVVTCAKAFRLQAIDLVYINYKDLAGLEKQSTEGAHMGFTGKQVIHPGQIPVVQKAFSPSPDRVEWATELIQAFSQHTQTGKGAFTFRGAMIDMPLVLQARNIVRLAEAVKS